jgi:hypothetical protein
MTGVLLGGAALVSLLLSPPRAAAQPEADLVVLDEAA